MDVKPNQVSIAVSPTPFWDRADLIRRWQHGSDAFFWRQERAGRLLPVHYNGLLRYRMEDVLRFEGGQPSDDMAAAYAVDLMHPDQVADVCKCTPSYIINSAKADDLPCRRIGRAWRFVPAEVARWQQDKWVARARRMNAKPSKNQRILSDE